MDASPGIWRDIGTALQRIALTLSPPRFDGRTWTKRDQLAWEFFVRNQCSVQVAYASADTFLSARAEMMKADKADKDDVKP